MFEHLFGIRAAFGAPVGGLLFAMEEVSSFWKNKLSFQAQCSGSGTRFGSLRILNHYYWYRTRLQASWLRSLRKAAKFF
jgi:H+/Cl- antiporter ClcA